jgi:tetratricopeptide (TPR) repeat protein
LDSALDGLRQLSTNLQKKKIVDEQLIVAHTDMGDLYLRLGQVSLESTLEDARAEFETAHALVQEWLKETPDAPRAHFQHWIVNERLGDFYYANGDADAAYAHHLAAYDIALQHREAISALGDYQDDIDFGLFSLCFRIGGDLYRKFELDQAIQWLERAQAIADEADAKHDDIFPVESGEWYRAELKNRLDCWSQLPAARANIEFVATLDPDLQPRVLYCLASWLAYDGDVDRAAQLLDRLTEIPDLPPNTIYDAACGYCRCLKALAIAAKSPAIVYRPVSDDSNTTPDDRTEEFAKRALELLNRDLELGFFDFPDAMNLVANDPDLDPIRDRDDFREFIDKLKAHLASLDMDN